MSKRDHKLFAGPRLRLLRRSMGLTQSDMAKELGISPSYLNLIEANQRPLTARLLLKLAETYDTDLRSLSRANDAELFAALNEVFSDPLLRPFAVPKAELQEIANVSPAGAEAVAKLYATFRDYRKRMLASSSDTALRNAALASQEFRIPIDDVHDFLHAAKNYFDPLDQAAEALNYMAELYKSGVPKTQVPLEQGMRTGDFPIAISGNWKIVGLTIGAPEIRDRWGIAMLPKGPAGKRTSFIGGRVMGIFSQCKSVKTF